MMRKAMRLSIFALAVLMFCAGLAAAQDAGQVLRVSVGFNSMKNTLQAGNKLSGDGLAEIERLSELARQANGAGRYGEALKHLYHGFALMRGQPWTPARALGGAAIIKVDRAMLEPGQSFALRVTQIYSLDEKLEGELTGSIGLAKLGADGPAKELKALTGVTADFIAKPLVAELVAPEIEPGNYRLTLSLQPPKGEPITKTVTVHIERGLAAQVAALKQRAAKLEAALAPKPGNVLRSELPSAQYRLSLYDLANAGEINFERLNFQGEFGEAAAMLDALEARKNPFEGRKGDFRKAYLSAVDNTYQPYRVFVPTGYDGTKAYPLVIALHGMGGDENSFFEAYANGLFKTLAERHGYIVACPKGRKPASMYMGDAEKDVLDVLSEMQRAYRIDPDRVYLTGHSMGGYGTLSLAMGHPDIFAAIAPISGGVNNPLSLQKIARIPQLIVHGDADRTVSVERSRSIVEAGKKYGAEIKYIEVPGGDHGGVVAPHFEDVFQWFDGHRRHGAEAAGASAGSKNN